jgi:glutathione peroxidase-family protein
MQQIYNINKERGEAKKKVVHIHESREEVSLVRNVACACLCMAQY